MDPLNVVTKVRFRPRGILMFDDRASPVAPTRKRAFLGTAHPEWDPPVPEQWYARAAAVLNPGGRDWRGVTDPAINWWRRSPILTTNEKRSPGLRYIDDFFPTSLDATINQAKFITTGVDTFNVVRHGIQYGGIVALGAATYTDTTDTPARWVVAVEIDGDDLLIRRYPLDADDCVAGAGAVIHTEADLFEVVDGDDGYTGWQVSQAGLGYLHQPVVMFDRTGLHAEFWQIKTFNLIRWVADGMTVDDPLPADCWAQRRVEIDIDPETASCTVSTAETITTSAVFAARAGDVYGLTEVEFGPIDCMIDWDEDNNRLAAQAVIKHQCTGDIADYELHQWEGFIFPWGLELPIRELFEEAIDGSTAESWAILTDLLYVDLRSETCVYVSLDTLAGTVDWHMVIGSDDEIVHTQSVADGVASIANPHVTDFDFGRWMYPQVFQHNSGFSFQMGITDSALNYNTLANIGSRDRFNTVRRALRCEYLGTEFNPRLALHAHHIQIDGATATRLVTEASGPHSYDEYQEIDVIVNHVNVPADYVDELRQAGGIDLAELNGGDVPWRFFAI